MPSREWCPMCGERHREYGYDYCRKCRGGPSYGDKRDEPETDSRLAVDERKKRLRQTLLGFLLVCGIFLYLIISQLVLVGLAVAALGAILWGIGKWLLGSKQFWVDRKENLEYWAKQVAADKRQAKVAAKKRQARSEVKESDDDRA